MHTITAARPAKLAHIRHKQFDDGTIGFVLWSREGRLLLLGSRVPASGIEPAVHHFIGHCGTPELYGARQVQGAWVLELFDAAGRRIGWAPPLDTRADALAVRQAVLHAGPILSQQTGGLSAPLAAMDARPQAADCVV